MRVFVIDDSLFYRRVVAELAASIDGVSVAGTAEGCDEALRKLERDEADVVLCDVFMPGKDGLATLTEIRRRYPDMLVAMMSGVSTRGAESTVRALQMGAFEFVRKPDSKDGNANVKRLSQDLKSVLRLAGIHLNTANAVRAISGVAVKNSRAVSQPPNRTSDISTVERYVALGIGVSTGGPEALSTLLPALPADFPVPVLLVQHMPPSFTKALAESLNRKCALHITEAQDDEPVEPGHVYMAPGGMHMRLRRTGARQRVQLSDTPPVHNCRPSVDVLFQSMAEVYDGNLLAVVLTGMGDDGCEGVREMKRRGCCCLTQSPESCVVYGMPRMVVEAGLSDCSLPIEEIAGALKSLTTTGRFTPKTAPSGQAIVEDEREAQEKYKER
ncbi:MAG: chemotaxis-specific protein-glutamate methyltransferase CheB [Chitinivibrionales bacterium]|nr:chemotaxis-specific protein-glutamate methyltransferase CheB [Chitinivibrionales bacterium]